MQLNKQGSSLIDVVQLFYKKAQECEQYWKRDNYMATKIQAYFRMYVLCKKYQRNRAAAVTIQKYSRAYLARQTYKIKLSNAHNLRNIKYCGNQAKTIQRYFRGYMYRKYQMDFYVRKRQLQLMADKNNNFLKELYEVAAQDKLAEQTRQELVAREEFIKLASNLHHLSSTAVQPGIYKPPYAKDVPKAFDVDVETHLKVAFQTTYQQWNKKRSNSGFRIRPQSQKIK